MRNRSVEHNKLAEEIKDKIEHARAMDEENGHIAADQALCDLLICLGFSDVVADFNAMPKWYA